MQRIARPCRLCVCVCARMPAERPYSTPSCIDSYEVCKELLTSAD